MAGTRDYRLLPNAPRIAVRHNGHSHHSGWPVTSTVGSRGKGMRHRPHRRDADAPVSPDASAPAPAVGVGTIDTTVLSVETEEASSRYGATTVSGRPAKTASLQDTPRVPLGRAGPVGEAIVQSALVAAAARLLRADAHADQRSSTWPTNRPRNPATRSRAKPSKRSGRPRK